ncbi:MAG: hypothetical protein ACP5HU_04110 [Phycisphaerae bacterium]
MSNDNGIRSTIGRLWFKLVWGEAYQQLSTTETYPNKSVVLELLASEMRRKRSASCVLKENQLAFRTGKGILSPLAGWLLGVSKGSFLFVSGRNGAGMEIRVCFLPFIVGVSIMPVVAVVIVGAAYGLGGPDGFPWPVALAWLVALWGAGYLRKRVAIEGFRHLVAKCAAEATRKAKVL